MQNDETTGHETANANVNENEMMTDVGVGKRSGRKGSRDARYYDMTQLTPKKVMHIF